MNIEQNIERFKRNTERVKMFLWIISFQLIGTSLGVLTQTNITPWYNNLVKSNLTPPPIVFSIVWPLLYVLLAVAAYLLWKERQNSKVKPALYYFTGQILMNWVWTPIFFQFHWIAFSFFWILTIIFLTIATILLIKPTHRMVSLLLMPYLLWLIFASYLNGSIWLLN